MAYKKRKVSGFTKARSPKKLIDLVSLRYCNKNNIFLIFLLEYKIIIMRLLSTKKEAVSMKRGLFYIFADTVSLEGWDYILVRVAPCIAWWDAILDLILDLLGWK